MTAGGKAQGLLRLATIAPVPPFTVLESEWLAKGPMAASKVADIVRKRGLHPPFAVRSSGLEEDGKSLAFAGVYESVMPVEWAGLEVAVGRVWQSGSSERVRVYREKAGLPPTASGVSVVIQELVDSRSSGVAFSRSPWDESTLAIEAVAGLGSSLVDGEATPERHEFRREPVEFLSFTPGRQFLAKSASGTRRLLAKDVSARRLAREDATSLAQLVLDIEQQWLESPNGVDIEWCIDATGKLFIVQCRPITTAAVRPAVAG